MSENTVEKQRLLQLGRILTLLFNRATMYQADHPYIRQALGEVYQGLNLALKCVSPIVFILNRGQFFIDEEALDPRINVSRIIYHFKKAGIESISFEKGLTANDLTVFLEIFSTLGKYPNAEAMKRALEARKLKTIKINHVTYKKVTADDEVISKDALQKVMPDLADESGAKTKKMFLDALLEGILTEEFIKSLNIQTLMKSPESLSRKMVEADLAGACPADGGEGGSGTDTGEAVAGASAQLGTEKPDPVGGTPGGPGSTGSEGGGGAGDGVGPGGAPGRILLHELERLDVELERDLAEKKDLDISELARAVFAMKVQIMEGIQAQKALGVAYENEAMILEKANEMTDRVLIRLIQDEYRSGDISTSRLAQILRRLIPQAGELKRLLPKIKSALIEQGMPVSEYLDLVKELSKELQNEGLAGLIEESAEAIGVDGEGMVAELKRNPQQAAELIYLASEIRKGTGDENVLTDLLVDYVERLGSKMTLDIVGEDGKDSGKEHLEMVMKDVRSKIVRHLGNTDLGSDVLSRLEERLNQRMDALMDQLRVEWLRTQAAPSDNGPPGALSVLQTLERSVSDNEEMGEILKTIRARVASGAIDENDFRQIHTEILREKQARSSKQGKRHLPAGILKPQSLMLFLQKEAARSKRYGTPFSVLAFSVVKARGKGKGASGAVTQETLMDAVLEKLAHTFRETDVLGQLERNRIMALLPMTASQDAKSALRRAMKMMHLKPLEVNGIPLELKMAGVLAHTETEEALDVDVFVKSLFSQLSDMAARIKTLHAYF